MQKVSCKDAYRISEISIIQFQTICYYQFVEKLRESSKPLTLDGNFTLDKKRVTSNKKGELSKFNRMTLQLTCLKSNFEIGGATKAL